MAYPTSTASRQAGKGDGPQALPFYKFANNFT
jgi:hypothetical protein